MLETEKHKGDPIIINNDFLFVTAITGLLASYLTLVGKGSKSGFCGGDRHLVVKRQHHIYILTCI